MDAVRPVTLLIGALGGEGGGVLAAWLVEIATRAGHVAQATSIPGVAQRTGATTYYVEILPLAATELDGRAPVLSLLPVPGGVDVVVASELLEAVRIVSQGFVSPDRTLLLASTSRTLTTTEKMALGDGRFDPARLLAVAQAQSRHIIAFDMDAVARANGTMVSAVMLGALAGSGTLPYGREAFETVVANSGRGAEASLRGFAQGWDAVRKPAGAVAPPADDGAPGRAVHADPGGGSMRTVTVEAVEPNEFPATVAEFVALGRARLTEFQDTAYADLFVARVRRVLAAEARADRGARHARVMTREAARYLALWMAFDDIVRVAGSQVSCQPLRARAAGSGCAGGRDRAHRRSLQAWCPRDGIAVATLARPATRRLGPRAPAGGPPTTGPAAAFAQRQRKRIHRAARSRRAQGPASKRAALPAGAGDDRTMVGHDRARSYGRLGVRLRTRTVWPVDQGLWRDQ